MGCSSVYVDEEEGSHADMHQQADGCVGPCTGAGGSWCVESAHNVSQCGDVNTEQCVRGEGVCFGRESSGGDFRGGRVPSGLWPRPSSLWGHQL